MSQADPLVEITGAGWDLVVGRSPLPVLLCFGSSWCSHCRAMEPVLRSVARQRLGQALVGHVDTGKERELARKYRIRSIPQVVVFFKGEVAERPSAGEVSEEELLAILGRMAIRRDNHLFSPLPLP